MKKRSLAQKVADQKRIRIDFSEFPTAFHRRLDESKTDALGDTLSRVIWRQWYGNKSKAKCVVCGVTSVRDTPAGYDRAHVVARAHHGRNNVAWNRVATCRTCNAEDRTGNLLDYVYLNYRKSLFRVCRSLYKSYCADHPHLAEHLDRMPLGEFISRVYGANLEQRDEIQRSLEHMCALAEQYEQALREEKALTHQERMALVAVQDAEKQLRLARNHLDAHRGKKLDLELKMEKFMMN